MPAPKTDKANIRAEADNFPVRTAAGMGLPQTYDVVKRNIEWHFELPIRPLAVAAANCLLKKEV